ncbi:hypothetical protein [Formosa sp. Hel1_33_131]|uniref:hypothetical protein n=1 Tax=Formosa sp. Hel1_33_131 TaxID=1336794 RepID=UPI0012FB2A3B|nr:hypothetical protein [Formosa sp. Hel1_33_131]
MNKANKIPDFLAMSQQLLKDLQSDAEIKGMEFIHSNFEKQGFTDNAFEAWKPRKESMSYNLLRVTNNLFNSINVASSTPERITFEADAPYASIHNEGGILNVPITERSRKYFWFMFKQTGKGMWRAMALTKKTRLTIKIDQRQFMGHSNTFSEDWNNHVTQEILTRFKNL